MRMRSPQASRSLGRFNTITKVDFLAPDAIDSSMVSPTTDTEVPPSTVTTAVPDHDVDEENGDELARTRRRHSQGTSYGHPGLAGPTCEVVHRCCGRACVAPRPWSPPCRAGLTRSGHSVSVYGWYYARDGSHPSLRTTCAIVHVRMAPCGRHNLLHGRVPGPYLRVLCGACRVSSPASACAVQRRKWLKRGLGKHHGYPLGTPCACERVARPPTARVSFRAPSAKSAAKGHPFKVNRIQPVPASKM